MATQKLLKLTISRVDGPVFDGEVISATLPGVEGEMTLLADHAPIVSILKTGTIMIKKADGTTEKFPVESGTIEVSHNSTTVLL
jgi:F-type H+-transporting ATPase subunit epsilon